MMDFARPDLVAEYGSWVRVQVAFYDFLFQTASTLCPEHWNTEALLATVAAGEFADGSNFYERTVQLIETAFLTPEQAWEAFIAAHTEEEDIEHP